MSVFDVLREKLKEKSELYRREEEIQKANPCYQIGVYGFKATGYEDAIEIVNQVEKDFNNGWIPCSERLPQENEPVDAVCEVVNIMLKSGTVTSGWCNRYLERWYVLDEHCDYPLHQNYEDVIAWQPLPPKYEPKGE